MVGQFAIHLRDFYITDTIMAQHGGCNLRAAHAVGKRHLRVFIEFAFQHRTQNESDDHENNTNDNQHRNVVLLIFFGFV